MACSLIPHLQAGDASTPMDRMRRNASHFLNQGGEVARMTMTQEDANGRVLRTNRLLAVTHSAETAYRTVIWVKDDGTLFFSEQSISETAPSNTSWMYIPPLPGVQNSGRLFRVNQNTLRQPFIGSDFDVLDLERLNIFDGETYEPDDEEGWIRAVSDRYGERRLRLDDEDNIVEIQYFHRGNLVKISRWEQFSSHRSERFVMERYRRGNLVRRTVIEAEYLQGVELPEAVFDRGRLQSIRGVMEELEKGFEP